MILFNNRSGWSVILATVLASLFFLFPIAANAESESIELTFEVYGDVTYESVWQDAEGLARTAIDEAFSEDSSISEVVVVIMADRNGRVVPLLSLNVPRSEWRGQSGLTQWIAWTAPTFSSETLLAIGIPIPDRPAAAANPRPRRPTAIDSLDLIENDPAFRDD